MKKIVIVLLLSILSICNLYSQTFVIKCISAKMSFANEITGAFGDWQIVNTVSETNFVLATFNVEQSLIKFDNELKSSFKILVLLSNTKGIDDANIPWNTFNYNAVDKDGIRVVIDVIISDSAVVVIFVSYKNFKYQYTGILLDFGSEGKIT